MGIVDGKVALVTGGGRGIGAGIALAFAKQGAALALCSPRLEDMDEICSTLRGLGASVEAFACDVTVPSQVDDFVTGAADRFGGIDILVNNAAVTEVPEKPLEEVSAEEIRQHMEVDVLGSRACMVAALPYLKRNGGAIINFGSGAGTQGLTNRGAYVLSKEAVRALTKLAANDWGRYGITVNVVCPAARTEGYEAWLEGQHPGMDEEIASTFVLGRMGDPELDIGQAVVALASPMCNYITGRTICVDGGRSRFM